MVYIEEKRTFLIKFATKKKLCSLIPSFFFLILNKKKQVSSDAAYGLILN